LKVTVSISITQGILREGCPVAQHFFCVRKKIEEWSSQRRQDR